METRLGHWLALCCLAAFTGTAQAQDLDLTLPDSGFYKQEAQPLILAANDVDKANAQIKAGSDEEAASQPFEPRMFSASKVHQYLGVGTVALAGMAFMTHIHPVGDVPRDVNGVHGDLGKAAGAMALATVASGLYAHWDDFHLEDGWSDPDNLHVFLATAGALLMSYAVYQSATQTTGTVNHAGMAEAGALSMLIAVKLTW